MIAARPSTPEIGMPPAIDLATRDEVGLDAEVLHREHAAGAAEAGLHLVGDQHDAVLVADLAQAAQVLGAGRHEAALALHGLDDDRGHRLRRDARLQRALEVGQRDLGGVRAERYAFGNWTR